MTPIPINREIKFRAWDKRIKEFVYVTFHPSAIGWPHPEFSHSRFQIGPYDEFEGISFEDIEGWKQYTGLKDKNGREIYEGDIIDVYYSDNTENCDHFIGQIKWGSHPDRNGWSVLAKEDIIELPLGLVNLYIIIGNIYENPELLK